MKTLSRRTKYKSKTLVSLIADTSPKSVIAEQYRLIRTNIEFASVDKNIKSIVVTSPAPGDGKSTTATNLSIVLAQQGKKVILVDADLRKPSLHYTFKLDNMDGLTSVLTKKTNLEKAIIKTHILNLSILTTGLIPPNPSELLNSQVMESLIEELNGKFDYIIFDTPPVLAATDSQVLANKCDGVIMVITRGKTIRNEAAKAKKLLYNTKSHQLGVVLNRVEPNASSYSYLY
ncbi:CpsD/CapB family tyrosine-protein kinase [Priestia aryabhattai]|uniref:CpsD/CapB family tyrosine-protein kinase n=1 Tax=Priestia aryabhattai TaxID=412384 RepID=UPI003D293F4A